ncbi:MAG: type I restriction endonuclease subunit R [Thermoanaerobaculia bacterium]|nr:type I restriction endonuclease subunit R [Thermoanaerobaculia bacterium]
MSSFESVVEKAAVGWLEELGYEHRWGPDIAKGGLFAERESDADAWLPGRIRAALERLNPHLGEGAREEAFRILRRTDSPALAEANHAVHRLLTKGIDLQVRRGGEIRGEKAWLLDFERPERNDWLVVNQLSVLGSKQVRRPDLVVYVNGLPLAVLELKNPEDPNATLQSAWNQLQTYKAEIPGLFLPNALLAVSDGGEARVGSLTAGLERFAPWRTVDGTALAPEGTPQLEVLVRGLFAPERLLDYLRSFVLWETDDGFVKKIAGYHQFHAVRKAVAATVRAASPRGDRRVGVIWHTQGSGKSVLMVFYAAKLLAEPAMANPTLVVLTDRNDLDGQLHAQFAAAKNLLPAPEQAESREHLKELLRVASGGIVFTTLQKFGVAKGERYPELSDRRNIVVIADEAHRSQYEFIDGFARHLRDALPNASFIGFTGTPIELDDRSTPAVFGDYIDTYTISQSIADQATVPLYYEARLARISLPEDQKPKVDEEFEELTEGEEEDAKRQLKTKWARLEAAVGAERRLEQLAADLVAHWERRREILAGKAMVVAMSRRICAELYRKIVELRPTWHADGDDAGAIKVVITGSASDEASLQPHIRNKSKLKAIEKRFKDPDDPMEIVIVRDMWLTGFDAPCAHTIYLDKPMRGHGLMQAIARVNRVFRDKPGGLVVDYLGLAEQLRRAVDVYGGDPRERPGIPAEQALEVLLERFEIVQAMFHGFDYSGYFGKDAGQRLAALSGGANHIASPPAERKKRFFDAMAALNAAAGLAIHLEGARHLIPDVAYFQAVHANLRKYLGDGGGGGAAARGVDLDAAVRQIVSEAITPDGVVDVFGAAGIRKPDLSILSDEFLDNVQRAPYRNLQLELLRKLLADKVQELTRQNVVQSRKFSEMLERTLLAYQNRTLETAEVILELIRMAKELRDTPKRGDALGLSDDELAFYDALADHGDVREVMGDAALAAIAHDLVAAIRRSVAIDWTQKESVRAAMRTRVRRLLRQHGYPPDKSEAAVATVLEQAETLCRDWAEAMGG